MTKNETIKITKQEVPEIFDGAPGLVKAYERLVERAVYIANGAPFYVQVAYADAPRLFFDGDDVVLSWRKYTVDYYDDGYDEDARFPAAILFFDDEKLENFRAEARKETREQLARRRDAERAAAREQAEAHDRAEWERLKRKFGDGVERPLPRKFGD